MLNKGIRKKIQANSETSIGLLRLLAQLGIIIEKFSKLDPNKLKWNSTFGQYQLLTFGPFYPAFDLSFQARQAVDIQP